MGLLGGLLLVGGISFCLMGIFGVVLGIYNLDWINAGYSAIYIGVGLVAGAVATSILE